MATNIYKLARDLQNVLTDAENRKPKAYDTSAEVTRVDGDTLWVHIPGGVDETPVKKTVNAKAGDTVQIRVSNGAAYTIGNATNPPTDDTVADEAQLTASDAKLLAQLAKALANSAETSSASALISSLQAQTIADSASVTAQTAQLTSDDISKVVDVVQWANNYGEYELTNDTEVINGKLYFKKVNDQYTAVNNPEGNPTELGYYELTQMSETITKYVATHMSFNSHGLWLQSDGESYRICVTPTGVEIWSSEGVIANYSTAVTLGNTNGLHIVLDSGRLAFYDGPDTVAWVSSSQLYINDATVRNELRIGNFAWTQRDGRLTLKHIGG